MYYSPTIVQFAGFASNQTALALSLITSGLNVVGTVISMCFVDRYGRRRLMIVSMIGIITCLGGMPRELAWLLSMISGVRVAKNIVYGTAKVVLAKLEWNCTLDCQLRNIPTEIQRHNVEEWLQFKLECQSHCERDLLDPDSSLGFCWHLPPFAGISVIGLVAIYLLVPETKGMQFEEVEKLLQKGF
ncbi:hypothetical protein GBA52_022096 [Prunus armeniaca]|nr:hypothetical protein GBA52_022096 [Prunus armeniaca]